MERFSAVAALVCGFLVAALVGYWLVSPDKKGKTGQNETGGFSRFLFEFLLPFASLAGVAAGGFLYGFLSQGGEGTQTVWIRMMAGLVLACGFGFVGWLDSRWEPFSGGLPSLWRTGALWFTSLCAAGVLALGGDTTVLTIPFVGQWDLKWRYPFALSLLLTGLGETAYHTWVADGLCHGVSFGGGVGIWCCGAVLGLTGSQIYAGALTGAVFGFALWQFAGARLSLGPQGVLFSAGMLGAACIGCGLPLLLVPVFLLPIADWVSTWLGAGGKQEEKGTLSQRLLDRGWSRQGILSLYFLFALLGSGINVAFVWMMFGR